MVYVWIIQLLLESDPRITWQCQGHILEPSDHVTSLSSEYRQLSLPEF